MLQSITPYIIHHCSILLQLVFRKAHNSLNLTPLGFVVFGAGSQHKPQVAGETRAARQWIRGGARRTEIPRTAPSPAPLSKVQGLIGEEGYQLVPGWSRLIRESTQSGQCFEHCVQPGSVFG